MRLEGSHRGVQHIILDHHWLWNETNQCSFSLEQSTAIQPSCTEVAHYVNVVVHYKQAAGYTSSLEAIECHLNPDSADQLISDSETHILDASG
jgi:lipoprotein NlpI